MNKITDSTPRILVVGQGLAGAVAAVTAASYGWETSVIDLHPGATASRAAAGILNPITGPRLNLSWNVNLTFPFAESFYRSLEALLAVEFFRPMQIRRIFRTAAEVDFHSQRYARAHERIWLGPLKPSSQSELGECAIEAAALDVAVLLDATRRWLSAHASVYNERLDYNDLAVADDGVTCKYGHFHKVLFCEGHQVSQNPWFGHLPFKPAKGQSIKISLKKRLAEEIISSEKWLLPLEKSTALAGSTYEWRDLDEIPTPEGRDLLMRKVASMLPDNSILKLLDHRAGIRPCSHDRRPYVGCHPRYPQLGILNGLGSKGSLFAPWCADQWFQQAENGTLPDPAIDVARCRKAWRSAS